MGRLTEEQAVLLSGYLDGELGPEEMHRIEVLIAENPHFRHELSQLRTIAAGTVAAFSPRELPTPAMWDGLTDGVYARVERRTGWLLLCVGLLLLLSYGLFLYVSGPWASPVVKVLIALPVIGLFVLFVSVLRQRVRAASSDRYSREVFR
jgi:hypothetical protein